MADERAQHDESADGVRPHGKRGPRVLIVRPSALGDVCRTVPALATLRKAMPDARIEWVVNDRFVQGVMAHPALDGVIPFPRRSFAGAWCQPRRLGALRQWLGMLREARYDLVFDLQGLFRSGMITRATRGPRRVGDRNARELAWLGYNVRHRIDRDKHTVDHMLALLEAEGYDPVHDMRLYTSPEDDAWRDELLDEHGGSAEPYVCLAPTARWLCKCWPAESFVTLGQRLLESGVAGRRVVVIGSPNEREFVKPLVDGLSKHGVAVAPQTTVGQMMSLIAKSSLFIGNDSAPLHIAVGFDRPLVALFGPTDPARVGPFRRDDAVIRPASAASMTRIGDYRKRPNDQSLIAQITVDQVWAKIEEQLQPLAA